MALERTLENMFVQHRISVARIPGCAPYEPWGILNYPGMLNRRIIHDPYVLQLI